MRRRKNSCQQTTCSLTICFVKTDRSLILIFSLSFFLRGKATCSAHDIAFYLTILASIPCFDPDRRQIAETPERGNFYVLFQSIRTFQRLPLLAVSILPSHISRLSNEILLYPLIRYSALLLLRSRRTPRPPTPTMLMVEKQWILVQQKTFTKWYAQQKQYANYLSNLYSPGSIIS